MQKPFTEQIAERILNGETNGTEESPKSRQPLSGFKVPNQEFYSPRQVAHLLLFSDQTVWRWIRQGRIPTVRVGRYYRIPFNALLELVKNGNVLMRQNVMNQVNFGRSKF